MRTSHGVVLLAVLVILVSLPAAADAPGPFGVSVSVERIADRGVVRCVFEISNLASEEVLLNPRLESQPGKEATAEAEVELEGETYQFSCSCTVSDVAARYAVQARDGEVSVFAQQGEIAFGGFCDQ